MKIPYGMANFAQIQEEGFFYADKTHFIPLLESNDFGNRYLVFLRPRRFGKSLLVSMLRYYYDLAEAQRFDRLFRGLHIHQNPTHEHNRYLVLPFDFSTVDASAGKEVLRTGFTNNVREAIRRATRPYLADFPAFAELQERLGRLEDAASLLDALLSAARSANLDLYLLVDEYDSVPNDLLARGETDLYQDMVMDKGFMRAFYKAIKAGAQAGIIRRVFITGVTPVPLDDMASGFNISTNISTDATFNTLCGFTRNDVADAVHRFLARTPELGEPQTLLETLAALYDGYCFTEHGGEPVFNPDMVLYYLRQLRVRGGPPTQVLDINVRTDYTKIRAIASPPGGSQAWHLDYLQNLLTEGGVTGNLVESFGSRNMYDQRHLTSLLYFMGLLTLAGTTRGRLRFAVPNRVVQTLHWEELASLLRDRGGARVDVEHLLDSVSTMAYDGDPAPFLALVRDGVLKRLSNRDLIRFDEKHLKLLLLTYLSFSPIYQPVSEQEMAQGYCDLLLALDNRFPDATYAYVLELKHLNAGARDDALQAARAQAAAQLDRYLADPRLPALLGHRTILGVSVILVGATNLHWWVERALRPNP